MTKEEVTEVADWLVQIGYGFDFACPGDPLPEFLRRPLAEAWLRSEYPDGITSGETVESYYETIHEEGCW